MDRVLGFGRGVLDPSVGASLVATPLRTAPPSTMAGAPAGRTLTHSGRSMRRWAKSSRPSRLPASELDTEAAVTGRRSCNQAARAAGPPTSDTPSAHTMIMALHMVPPSVHRAELAQVSRQRVELA